MKKQATLQLLTTTDKVKAAVNKGMKKKSIAQLLHISRPTFYGRLKDNSWTDKEVALLIANGII